MGWKKQGKYLVKEFELQNFKEAVVFVGKIMPIAEMLEHHPDISIHSYNKVKIMTATHSDGKITKKDRELAKMIDSLVK